MLMSFCVVRSNTTDAGHTVYVSQAKGASATAEEQEVEIDVEVALAALDEESDINLEETRCSKDTVGLQKVSTFAWRTVGEPRLQTCDRAHQWREMNS